MRRITVTLLSLLLTGAGTAVVDSASATASAGAAGSVANKARVTRHLSLHAPASVSVGSTVGLAGRLRPSPKGSEVIIQKRVGDHWQTLKKTRTTNAHGAYHAKFTAHRSGTVTVRAIAPKRHVKRHHKRTTLTRAVSSARAVKVRVVYANRNIDGSEDRGLQVFDGSGDPAFANSYSIYSWDTPASEAVTGSCCDGYSAHIRTVGSEAWMSFDLDGRCRHGELWVRNSDGVSRFDVQTDETVRSTRVVGAGVTMNIALPDLAGVDILRISATWTNANDRSSTVADVRGYLNCDSTL